VTITPADSSAPPRALLSSATGAVEVGPIASGDYIVEGRRWLTAAERSTLPANQDVLGWVIRSLIRFSGNGGDRTVPMPASRRRGLMIGEWGFNWAALPPVNETYRFGGYLEIHNNADTTSYLDGLIIAHALVYEFDYPNFPCALVSVMTNDPDGIWTREVQQFPGTGREHPVPPGGTVVVAIDAIDHSLIVSHGLDLSRSDFEFWGGPGDVDNPAVPNMVDTLAIGANALGHGPLFQSIASVAVLAHHYNRATVPRRRDLAGVEYARIPGDHILDVVTLWPNFVAPWPRCQQLVNRRFDRASFDGRGYDENVEYTYSISRRRSPEGSVGPLVLQHSRRSDSDFIRTPRSPGRVP
jgi:hypothetical protein